MDTVCLDYHSHYGYVLGMKLNDYLKTHNLTDSEFAQQFGCFPSVINRWKSGERIPRPAQMARLYEITSGVVTPADFYDLPLKAVKEASV